MNLGTMKGLAIDAQFFNWLLIIAQETFKCIGCKRTRSENAHQSSDLLVDERLALEAADSASESTLISESRRLRDVSRDADLYFL